MAALITFEGVEGCGKTTQIGMLARTLEARGIRVVATREPGGTALGERLRAVLKDPASAMTPLAELFVLEAARAQLVDEVVRPALQGGAVVLADRFADSSLAYQAGARGLPPDLVAELNAVACGPVRPDRTLVLDLPVEVALERARGRPDTAGASRFEDETLAFHRAVAAAFRRLADAEPGRVRVVDAGGSPADVHSHVLAALSGDLP